MIEHVDDHPVAPSVAIVMPAYNEERRIDAAIEAIGRYNRERSVAIPLVLGDDGSTDGTVDRATRLAAEHGVNLTVLRFAHRGKALTVRDAMLHSAATLDVDYLLMLDADNELAIDQLNRVIFEDDRTVIYIGRRIHGDDSGRGPTPIRRIMSGGMRVASRLLLGLRHPDTQCGFKLFPRELVQGIFGQQRSSSWVFDAELLVIAERVSHLSVREVWVAWRPRGDSHVRPTAALSSALGLLEIAWRTWARTYAPASTSAGQPVAATTERSPGAVPPGRPENQPEVVLPEDRRVQMRADAQ